jgi:very-short-patch-repair endonuclease
MIRITGRRSAPPKGVSQLQKRKVMLKSPLLIPLALPRVVGDPVHFSHVKVRSKIRSFASARIHNPTLAERRLDQILMNTNRGALRGRFKREHIISGKWIVDFFFPEVRLAIEVDGEIHDTPEQMHRDAQKTKDCERFDITLVRVRNSEVFGDRELLLSRLREGWREAKGRKNKIVGRTSSFPK